MKKVKLYLHGGNTEFSMIHIENDINMSFKAVANANGCGSWEGFYEEIEANSIIEKGYYTGIELCEYLLKKIKFSNRYHGMSKSIHISMEEKCLLKDVLIKDTYASVWVRYKDIVDKVCIEKEKELIEISKKLPSDLAEKALSLIPKVKWLK
jgi:hypothetical protein